MMTSEVSKLKNRFRAIPAGEEVPEEVWEEQRLFYLVTDLSKYFGDMLFTKGTPTYEMLSSSAPSKADKAIDFDLTDCIYKVEPIRGNRAGKFSPSNFSLTIAPSFFPENGGLSDKQKQDRDSVILHEMIHMYEFVLDEYAEDSCLYRKILSDYLNKKLISKDTDLIGVIREKSNPANLERIREIGGEHDLLFLLKSIDLDLQVGADVGTIFFY